MSLYRVRLGGRIDSKVKAKKEKKKKTVGWTFLNDMAHQGKKKKKQKHITERKRREWPSIYKRRRGLLPRAKEASVTFDGVFFFLFSFCVFFCSRCRDHSVTSIGLASKVLEKG
jgi:hypothetical protein